MSDRPMLRGLLWLLAGLVLLAVVLVATAPELLSADPGELTGLLSGLLALVLPGLGLLAVVAWRRTRATRREPGER